MEEIVISYGYQGVTIVPNGTNIFLTVSFETPFEATKETFTNFFDRIEIHIGGHLVIAYSNRAFIESLKYMGCKKSNHGYKTKAILGIPIGTKIKDYWLTCCMRFQYMQINIFPPEDIDNETYISYLKSRKDPLIMKPFWKELPNEISKKILSFVDDFYKVGKRDFCRSFPCRMKIDKQMLPMECNCSNMVERFIQETFT